MELPIHLFNIHAINAGDVSADITSDAIDSNEVRTLSAQIIWSGSSVTGSLKITASNDGSTYTAISTTSVSGNSGNAIVNLPDIGYASVRVEYTHSSGSGTIDVYVNAKR